MNFRERFTLCHLIGKLEISFFERTAKAAHSVTILANIFAFGFIEDVANVGSRVAARFDQGDEVFDQFFEENIVLPQGIVGVDHQGVASHGW